mgnify:CR=1 FL=1
MDILSDAVSTHVFMIYIFLVMMFFNLYSVYTVKDFKTLARRLKFMTPMYHLANAMIIYTGAIVSAYTHDISPTVILMIAGAIFLMVIEIKRFKKMRTIKTTDTEKQVEFFAFAKKVYTIEVAVLCAVYILSKVF